MKKLLMRGGVVGFGMASGYMANVKEFPVVQIIICLLAIGVFLTVEVIIKKEEEIEKWK